MTNNGHRNGRPHMGAPTPRHGAMHPLRAGHQAAGAGPPHPGHAAGPPHHAVVPPHPAHPMAALVRAQSPVLPAGMRFSKSPGPMAGVPAPYFRGGVGGHTSPPPQRPVHTAPSLRPNPKATLMNRARGNIIEPSRHGGGGQTARQAVPRDEMGAAPHGHRAPDPRPAAPQVPAQDEHVPTTTSAPGPILVPVDKVPIPVPSNPEVVNVSPTSMSLAWVDVDLIADRQRFADAIARVRPDGISSPDVVASVQPTVADTRPVVHERASNKDKTISPQKRGAGAARVSDSSGGGRSGGRRSSTGSEVPSGSKMNNKSKVSRGSPRNPTNRSPQSPTTSGSPRKSMPLAPQANGRASVGRERRNSSTAGVENVDTNLEIEENKMEEMETACLLEPALQPAVQQHQDDLDPVLPGADVMFMQQMYMQQPATVLPAADVMIMDPMHMQHPGMHPIIPGCVPDDARVSTPKVKVMRPIGPPQAHDVHHGVAEDTPWMHNSPHVFMKAIQNSSIVADNFCVSTMGLARKNEDRSVVFQPPKLAGVFMAIIIDGHASQDVAILVRANMHRMIAQLAMSHPLMLWGQILEIAYHDMHGMVEQAGMIGGCCALTVIIDKRRQELWTALVGDCRGVLLERKTGPFTKMVRLTADQKLEKGGAEWNRIVAGGGMCKPNPNHPTDMRVFNPITGSHTNITRAIGDLEFNPHVIPVPIIKVRQLSGAEECLILGSDGIWDNVTDDEAAAIAAMKCSAREAVYRLMSEAVAFGTVDDMTACVVYLKNQADVGHVRSEPRGDVIQAGSQIINQKLPWLRKAYQETSGERRVRVPQAPVHPKHLMPVVNPRELQMPLRAIPVARPIHEMEEAPARLPVTVLGPIQTAPHLGPAPHLGCVPPHN